jgi:transcriptional regulator with XRE-family HTH domain
MPENVTTRRLAREIRAARAYADLSREQVATEIGLDHGTVGRYERGEWKRPPNKAILDGIARATGIPQHYLDAGFLAPEDPAKRATARAAKAAKQRRSHLGLEPRTPPDEDDEDSSG